MTKIVGGWALFLIGLGVFIIVVVSTLVPEASIVGTTLWIIGAVASGPAILGGMILVVHGICDGK